MRWMCRFAITLEHLSRKLVCLCSDAAAGVWESISFIKTVNVSWDENAHHSPFSPRVCASVIRNKDIIAARHWIQTWCLITYSRRDKRRTENRLVWKDGLYWMSFGTLAAKPEHFMDSCMANFRSLLNNLIPLPVIPFLIIPSTLVCCRIFIHGGSALRKLNEVALCRPACIHATTKDCMAWKCSW